MAPAAAAELAALADGAIGRALRSRPRGRTGALASSGRPGRRCWPPRPRSPRCRASPPPTTRAPFGARGELSNVLDALGPWLRDLLAVAAGAEEQVGEGGPALLRQSPPSPV